MTMRATAGLADQPPPWTTLRIIDLTPLKVVQ